MHQSIRPRHDQLARNPRTDGTGTEARRRSTGLFFLRIVRLMAIGGVTDARAASMLMGQYGRNHRRPLVLIRAMMLELSRASGRRILLAPPCCGRMTADEALMLGALGCGEEAFGACHAKACELLDRDEAPGAATCFQAVSACFADLGTPFR